MLLSNASDGQKGSIENTNKLIREYIPKGVDFTHFSDSKIMNIVRTDRKNQ